VGRFDGPIPVAALDAARTGERDPRVREEVDAARGAP
jgi:hypothetical protein